MDDEAMGAFFLKQGVATLERARLTRLRRDYATRGVFAMAGGDLQLEEDRQAGEADRSGQDTRQDEPAMTRQRHVGLLLIVISAVSFGVMPVFARFAYAAGADAITVLLLRFGIAAVVMAAIMLVRREPFPRGRVLLGLVLMGACGYAGVSLAYFMALTMASAGLVALLLYLYPALVMVLSVVFLRERLGLVKIGELLLALTGIALTIGVTGRASALGLLLGMVAAVLYAIYILVGSRIVHQTGPIASSAIIMASAATVFAGIAAIKGLALPQSVAGWVAVGAIALISTVIAFMTFFAGLKRVGPVTASTLSTCEPVVTVVLAALVLGESMGVVQLLGGVLILLAAVTLVRRETGARGGVRRAEEDKRVHR